MVDHGDLYCLSLSLAEVKSEDGSSGVMADLQACTHTVVV